MKKLSVVIANRHQTSISLEEEFLDALKSISEEKKLSLNQLITEIDSMREHENLSSAIRVYILQHLFGKVLGKVVEFVVLTLEIHDYKAVELIYLAHIHNIRLFNILTAVKIARYRLGNSVRHARNLVYDSKLAAVEFFLPYIICYDLCLLRTADNVLGEGVYNKALHSTLRL